jgi:hypothetical protein
MENCRKKERKIEKKEKERKEQLSREVRSWNAKSVRSQP